MWSVKETNIPNFSKLIIFPYKKKMNEYKYNFEKIIERWKWRAIMTSYLTDCKVIKQLY